jgi:hypothetical protein
MRTKLLASVAALITIGIASQASAQEGVPLRYDQHYTGYDTQAIGSADKTIQARGKVGFYRQGKMRVLIAQFPNAAEQAKGVAVVNSLELQGIGWLECDGYVVTYAQHWVGGPAPTLNQYEALKGEKWLKRYSRRHDCTYNINN